MSTMKLPKIELPKFQGDYLKWRQFRDLFNELVHNQPLPACQKMWYLKGSVSGEPERMIRHLTTSEANYAAAWKIINERYENLKLLVNASLNKLLSQPTINTESASAIKMFHDTTHECLLALQNLGISTNQWDPIVLHILIKKLDRNTHTLWEQSLKQPKSLQSIDEFLNFLETRFQALESLGSGTKPERKSDTHKSLTATVKSGCCLCNGNHQLFACHRFLRLEPQQRLNLVKRNNACLNCLKRGHRVIDCSSRGCTKCEKRHNTLLHMQSSSLPHKESKDKATMSPPVAKKQEVNDTSTPQGALATTLTTASKGYVLLSTALVNIIHNNLTVECRAVLDSGSQLNFITQRLVNKLGIKCVPHSLTIEGIGSKKQASQKRVNIALESRINGFNTIVHFLKL